MACETKAVNFCCAVLTSPLETMGKTQMMFSGAFSELRDVRRAQGKRYALEPLLCAIVMSILSGSRSLWTMEVFIDEQLTSLNRLFGTSWRKAPCWVAIREFLLGLDEQELERAFREHAHRQASPPPGRQFIAIDGKASRGSADRVKDVASRQLVSAFDHDGLIVLGHIEMDDKSNEIPAAQAMIASFGLSERVFTLDALHCQKTLALEKEADAVVQVKGNQPTLLDACASRALHRVAAQCDVQHDKGHGRIETRTVHTFDVPPHWMPEEWQALVCQVAKIERTSECKTRDG